jgi:glycopeptide antibiotics resistance protein
MRKLIQQKLLWQVATIVYGALLVYIFFLARRRRHFDWSFEQNVNFIPFKAKWQKIQQMENINHPVNYNFWVDIIGNILLFIPIAIILRFIFQVKSLPNIIIYGLLISLSVEMLQLLLKLGTADIDDLILNTTGTAFGVFICKIVLYGWRPAENNGIQF